MPERECERNAEAKRDQPGGDVEAPCCGRHVCICCERPDRNIAEEIAHAHHADPEEEHSPGMHLSAVSFSRKANGWRCTRCRFRSKLRRPQSKKLKGHDRPQRWVRNRHFVDIGLPKDVFQAKVSLVDSQRIRLVTNEPRGETVNVFMDEEADCMGHQIWITARSQREHTANAFFDPAFSSQIW